MMKYPNTREMAKTSGIATDPRLEQAETQGEIVN
jgi:hypothetical protein